MRASNLTNPPFSGSYCELIVLLLEIEGLLSQLRVPPGRLYSNYLLSRSTLKSAILATKPVSWEEYRLFASSLNLVMITIGVLFTYADEPWRDVVDARLAGFQAHYPEVRSILGHVLCGLNLSPKGREDHFTRLSKVGIQRQEAS